LPGRDDVDAIAASQAQVGQVGGVDRTEYVDAGTRAWGWVPRRALHRFQAYAVEA